jgi:hypothetical protein
MPLWFNKLVRQLATALVAVAFVIAAFGPGLSVAHATGLGSFCPSFTSANAQDDAGLFQGHASASAHGDATVDQFGLDSPYGKANGAAKSPCCSSFCSPAFFSFPEHNVDVLAAINNDNWPVCVQVLTSADTGSLKRPPRTASDKFARA